METPVIVAIIGVLAAPVAAFITWFVNRKKHIADIYASLSESSQTAVETMQMTMTTLHDELLDAKVKIESLITENELLRQDLRELKNQNILLLEENKALRSKIDQIGIQMSNFKTESSDKPSSQHDN
jgi:regulator of replication initiation timing